jgi:thymidylate synthase
LPRTNNGHLPILKVTGANLPEAWERALIALWDHGVDIRTEYDRKDRGGRFLDPPSRDCTMIVEVTDPFAEPRIHKNFPGGPADLELYRQEVGEGIHDHWVDPSDPDKWTYTYHQRLFAYEPTTNLEDPKAKRLPPADQIEYVITKAASATYSRRIQATTWMPTADPKTSDPPCLQRLWFRLLPDDQGKLRLNLNTHWRSRDAYKAWFMNVFALTDLQRWTAERLAEKLGQPVGLGTYTDISDSFHLYGSYFAEFAPELDKMRKDPDYTKRAWPSDHPAVVMMFEETRAKLKTDADFMRSR